MAQNNRKKQTQQEKDESESFIVHLHEEMPSFMRSLFDSDEMHSKTSGSASNNQQEEKSKPDPSPKKEVVIKQGRSPQKKQIQISSKDNKKQTKQQIEQIDQDEKIEKNEQNQIQDFNLRRKESKSKINFREPKQQNQQNKEQKISLLQVQKAKEKLHNRHKPISKVLKDIRILQESTNLVCRKLPFQRLVRNVGIEVSEKLGYKQFRYSTKSLFCLQQLAEQFMVNLYEDSYLCTSHSRRVTLMGKDLNLAARIRGIDQPSLSEIQNKYLR